MIIEQLLAALCVCGCFTGLLATPGPKGTLMSSLFVAMHVQSNCSKLQLLCSVGWLKHHEELYICLAAVHVKQVLLGSTFGHDVFSVVDLQCMIMSEASTVVKWWLLQRSMMTLMNCSIQ